LKNKSAKPSTLIHFAIPIAKQFYKFALLFTGSGAPNGENPQPGYPDVA
jgi:hypothetical protein